MDFLCCGNAETLKLQCKSTKQKKLKSLLRNKIDY